MNPNRTVSSGEIGSHGFVLTSVAPADGGMSKRRQLPVDTRGGDQSEDITGIQPERTYSCTTTDSDSDNTETTELGGNDDITDRKHVTEYFIHPVTSMFVYMKSDSGGAPYVCKDCGYKTTVNSEWSVCRCTSCF